MRWRCIHLDEITVVMRIDAVVQADCVRRTLIELRLSQYSRHLHIFLYIEETRAV